MFKALQACCPAHMFKFCVEPVSTHAEQVHSMFCAFAEIFRCSVAQSAPSLFPIGGGNISSRASLDMLIVALQALLFDFRFSVYARYTYVQQFCNNYLFCLS